MAEPLMFRDATVIEAELEADPRMIALRRRIAEERTDFDREAARRLFQLKITICSERTPELLGMPGDIAHSSSAS